MSTIVIIMGTIGIEGNLSNTLFGKARRSLLSLFFLQPDESFYLRQIERLTGLGIGALQREIGRLVQAGIIMRITKDRQIYYQANKNCPVFGELKGIVLKTVGLGDTLRDALIGHAKQIALAFIYGSFAGGSERNTSDVDVLIIGDVSLGEVVRAFQGAQEKIGREINPTVYPTAEFRSMVKEKKHFLNTVLDGPMIFLIGDRDELEKLVR